MVFNSMICAGNRCKGPQQRSKLRVLPDEFHAIKR